MYYTTTISDLPMYQKHHLGFYEITFHKTTGVNTKEKINIMHNKNNVQQLYQEAPQFSL